MTAAPKRERNLPPSLLTVLYLPVTLVAAPLALEVTSFFRSPVPLILIPIAVIVAYAWAIPRVRRFP